MNALYHSERVARRIVVTCGLLAATAALVGILIRVFSQWMPWVAGVRGVFGMALHTSTPLLLLSLALVVLNRWPQRRVSRVLVGAVASLIGVMALLVLVRLRFPIAVEFEVWLVKTLTPAASDLPRHMSPHTALTFLCVAGAFGCLLGAGWTDSVWRRRVAFLLAAVGLLSGAIATVGLGLGTPLLFGREFTTMKWVTASIFVLLNAGLMFEALPRNWLLQELLGEASHEVGMEHVRYRRLLAVFLLCFAGCLVLVGFLFLRREQANLRMRAEKELTTLADLTAARTTQWQHEHMQQANLMLYTPFIARRAAAFFSLPNVPMNRQMLISWLQTSLPTGPYKEALILDDQLNVRLSYPNDPGSPLTEVERRTAEQAHRTRAVMATDLYQPAEASSAIRLSFMVPLVSQWGERKEIAQTTNPEQEARDRSPGVLVLRMDARQTLFPLLRRRPFSSPSVETYLVGREGEELVFLSDLRRETNAALRLRNSLSWKENPAVRAALGQEGVFQGTDYRGVRVLAATRAISGSPWSLVVQMDEQEIYAPLRARARDLGLILGALMLAATAGLNLLWRQRDNQFLRQQVAAEHERLVLAQRVAHLMDHANDIIIITDDQWHILEVNFRGQKEYGYNLAELREMLAPDLRPPEARMDFPEFDKAFRTHGQSLTETVHRRKDGSTFPVEVSARKVELDGVNHTLAIVRDITERKQVEEKLRESENRYRSLVDTAQDTVFTATVDGRFTSLNPAFEQATGWLREEWLGRNFAELVHPSDLPVALEMAAKVASGETSPIFEIRVRKSSGDYLVAQILATPRRRDGKVEDLLGIARDVTVAKQMEAALRESEEKLKLAVKASAMGVWDWDVRRNTVTWSPECYKIHGVKSFAGTLQAFSELVHPEDRARVMTTVNAAIAADKTYACEFRVIRPNGKIRWVDNLGQASYDASGVPVRMVGTTRDITERKQAEQEIENLARFPAENPSVVVRLSEDAQLLYANPAAKKILRQFVDKQGQVTSEWQETLTTVFARKEKVEFEREFDQRVFSFIVTPFVEQGYANIYGSDITELKRLQEQLLEVSDREQARIGQDLHDGLAQLLVTAAFDLNKLEQRLTSLQVAEAALAQQTAKLIDTAITQTRGVARGLFAVHLGGEGLAHALQDLVAKVTANSDIACDVLCPRVVPVENDAVATHLFRIAQEAVNNAVKHAEARQIEIRLSVRPRQIDLTVTDDGKGFRVANGLNSGMGLHIMDYRARAIKGRFKIESLPARGTRVSCFLPRQPAPDSKSI